MSEQYILVTGSTGFIGRHVVRKLARLQDLRLLCIVRGGERHPQANSLLNQGATLVGGEFCDEILLKRTFGQYQIRQVVHLAAIRGARKASPADFRRVNIEGTALLLREAHQHRVQKFIHCSSVGVYGTIPTAVPAGVETPLRGDTHYHQSKVAAEEAVHGYIQKGLNAYIVRPAIAYGPGDDGFPQTLVELVRRHLLRLPKSNYRVHLVDVEQLAEVFVNLVVRDHCTQRIFVAADFEPVPLNELVDWIHWHFYRRPYPRFLRLPDWTFGLAFHLFRGLGNEKWAVRVALICRDWYYQSADTYRTLGIQPGSTREGFGRFLGENATFPR
ncbi:MAG: NAD(P)-dependent oxidoreductase [Terriglobia bacterium]